MGRKGSVDKLPPEIRDLIGKLREEDGYSLDDIIGHLRQMEVDVSRSALHRFVRGQEELAAKLRRSRTVAETLVRQLGDAPESKTARLNIELLHGVILDLFRQGEAGEEVDKDGKAALAGNPMGAMMLAKALEHLTKASRHDADFILQVEKRATAKAEKEAAARVEQVAKAKGVSKDTVAAIKASIFGVKS